MERVIGVCTEKASAVFRIRHFHFVVKAISKSQTPRNQCSDLKRNSVSSGELLTVGPFAFEIVVKWSCDPKGDVEPHSMLGIYARQLWSDAGVRRQRLTLVNADPRKSCAIVDVCRARESGSFPSAYATERKNADGFALLSEVLDPASGWLIDENRTLTVECEIEVATSDVQRLHDERRVFLRTEEVLGRKIGALLESGRHADVLLVVGPEQIHAHSLILGAHSPVFEAIWSHRMKEANERKVIIEGVNPSAVRRMIGFMYDGKLDLDVNDDEVCDLLYVAHRYQVTAVVDACAFDMEARLTEEVAVKYLLQADLFGVDTLKSACVKFIVASTKRLSAIQRSKSFACIVQEQPHLLADLLAAAFPPAEGGSIETERVSVNRGTGRFLMTPVALQ
eukprot:TRINITY_DN26540_c0_g1_i1.p1 TRINITY_DN26540_c0_g1~~TRINITY_DN26540_c0_g1_i1.p1  ORF type:complete len:394 (-),score=54.10 TRINITY_DN26540_c0_g1_i1:438-1619(-)